MPSVVLIVPPLSSWVGYRVAVYIPSTCDNVDVCCPLVGVSIGDISIVSVEKFKAVIVFDEKILWCLV